MTVNISLDDVAEAVALARRAGETILKIYRSDFAVGVKNDRSPVTDADREAERIIVQGLRKLAASIPIVAEEAFSASRVSDFPKHLPFWLVDPLDGTKEFVNRNGEFTVNIALIEAGRPVLGVVHAPGIGATYWGSRHGSFAQTNEGAAHKISVRSAPADGLVALVSRSHPSPETDSFLATIRIKQEISAGSSLKFCLVAAGRADIYPRFGRTMEWDTAAGHAVLKFAGGHVRQLDGTELTYGKSGFENPYFVATGAD